MHTNTPFLHTGKGLPLVQASAAGSSVPNNPGLSVHTVAVAAFSVLFPAGNGLEMSLYLEFPAAATGDIEIYRKGPAGNDLFDTLAVAGVHTAEWKAGEALTGEFYVKNDTDQIANKIYGQMRIN